jgi:hypothetical protein
MNGLRRGVEFPVRTHDVSHPGHDLSAERTTKKRFPLIAASDGAYTPARNLSESADARM